MNPKVSLLPVGLAPPTGSERITWPLFGLVLYACAVSFPFGEFASPPWLQPLAFINQVLLANPPQVSLLPVDLAPPTGREGSTLPLLWLTSPVTSNFFL